MPPSHSSNSAEHRTGTKGAPGAPKGEAQIPISRMMNEEAEAAPSAWALGRGLPTMLGPGRWCPL